MIDYILSFLGLTNPTDLQRTFVLIIAGLLFLMAGSTLIHYLTLPIDLLLARTGRKNNRF